MQRNMGLPEDVKELVRESLDSGCNYVETARKLGISPSAVSRVDRTRNGIMDASNMKYLEKVLNAYRLGALAGRLVKTSYDKVEFRQGWEDARKYGIEDSGEDDIEEENG